MASMRLSACPKFQRITCNSQGAYTTCSSWEHKEHFTAVDSPVLKSLSNVEEITEDGFTNFHHKKPRPNRLPPQSRSRKEWSMWPSLQTTGREDASMRSWRYLWRTAVEADEARQ